MPAIDPGVAVTRTVPARVGLVGNPSDGYGGAVVATVVPSLAASVAAVAADGIAFDGAGQRSAWPSVDAGTEHVEVDGQGDEHRLISAALWTLVEHLSRRDLSVCGGVALEWSTTVPRSVGLAGSSALAVGVIDATAAAWGIELDRRVIAALALRAERDVLGIAAGWQDRIVQSFGCPVLVDARTMVTIDGVEVPTVSELVGEPPPLLVAWRTGDAASSDDYHAPLRRSADQLVAPMAELAALARNAARAWQVGDTMGVAAALDAAWLTRQASAPLRADHGALVELVRSLGLIATTPGSGGSVVAIADHPERVEAAVEALSARGCTSVFLPS